jgi:hypothetical protein
VALALLAAGALAAAGWTSSLALAAGGGDTLGQPTAKTAGAARASLVERLELARRELVPISATAPADQPGATALAAVPLDVDELSRSRDAVIRIPAHDGPPPSASPRLLAPIMRASEAISERLPSAAAASDVVWATATDTIAPAPAVAPVAAPRTAPNIEPPIASAVVPAVVPAASAPAAGRIRLQITANAGPQTASPATPPAAADSEANERPAHVSVAEARPPRIALVASEGPAVRPAPQAAIAPPQPGPTSAPTAAGSVVRFRGGANE